MRDIQLINKETEYGLENTQMAERHREYKPTAKLSFQERLKEVMNRIYEYKASNISDRTLAASLGCDLAKFNELLHQTEYKGEKPLLMAYEAGMATFEYENVHKIDEILEDPDTPANTKLKYLMERLKRLEQWAPATKAVRVQLEDTRTILEFESLSEAEQADIIAKNSINSDEIDDSNVEKE